MDRLLLLLFLGYSINTLIYSIHSLRRSRHEPYVVHKLFIIEGKGTGSRKIEILKRRKSEWIEGWVRGGCRKI